MQVSDTAMAEVRGALQEVTGYDPIYNDAEEGSFCVHCHARMCYIKQECVHTSDCAYVKCEKALAALDAEPDGLERDSAALVESIEEQVRSFLFGTKCDHDDALDLLRDILAQCQNVVGAPEDAEGYTPS